MSGAGVFQGGCGGSQRCTRREDVVYEEHVLTIDLFGPPDKKRILRVGLPLRLCETGLRPGVAFAPKIRSELEPIAPGDGLGQQFGLIESTLPALAPMHGHGDDDIETLVEGQGSDEQPAERPRQGFHFSVFKKMNELTEGTFITAERVRGVEIHQALPADGTEVVFVQRIGIHEGSSASLAEKFGRQRRWQSQAGGADWKPGNVPQRLLTKPAVVGKG